jgi:hypothetical protein
MESKAPESEIIIKITPKNLERLIYILIILGLLIFSIVEFYKKAGDCPIVDCANKTTTPAAVAAPKQETVAPASSAATEETAAEEEPVIQASAATGKVDFLLTDVKLCITNQTLDKGRFDTVNVYIKNSQDRQLNARVDLFLWDNNDPDELEQYPAQKIEKIKIMAGASLTHTYEMTGGMFTELSNAKTVKAILYDTDLNKKLGEQTKTNLKATKDC